MASTVAGDAAMDPAEELVGNLDQPHSPPASPPAKRLQLDAPAAADRAASAARPVDPEEQLTAKDNAPDSSAPPAQRMPDDSVTESVEGAPQTARRQGAGAASDEVVIVGTAAATQPQSQGTQWWKHNAKAQAGARQSSIMAAVWPQGRAMLAGADLRSACRGQQQEDQQEGEERQRRT